MYPHNHWIGAEDRCILAVMLDYEVTVTNVATLLKGSGPDEIVLLDVREPWEYETARIDGSVLIPMGDIPARIQELDPEARIVSICHHGTRSMNVTVWLRNQGFERAQSMQGGIDAWSREVDPKVAQY
jgi:rhodanese-related sulfurtransferase